MTTAVPPSTPMDGTRARHASQDRHGDPKPAQDKFAQMLAIRRSQQPDADVVDVLASAHTAPPSPSRLGDDPNASHETADAEQTFAKVFNADGFLHGLDLDAGERAPDAPKPLSRAAAQGDACVRLEMPIDVPSGQAISPAPESGSTASSVGSPTERAGDAFYMGVIEGREGSSRLSRTHGTITGASREPTVAHLPASMNEATATPAEAEQRAEAAGRLSSLRDRLLGLLREAQSKAASLSLECTGKDVHILVNIPSLSREERDRLRTAIERVVASHGLNPSAIRFGDIGEPRSDRSKEEH